MSKELILVGDVLDAEIVEGNLPVIKGEKPKKSNPTGIDIRTNQDGTKTYYILYRHNGKLIREKVGKDSEGITLAYCKKFRGERISLKNHGELAPSEIKKAKIKTSIKLNDIAIEYLAEIAHLSDGKTTEGRYNNHLLKPFGSKSLDEITKDDIEIFMKNMGKAVSLKTGRPYSNKTINDMVNLLNTIIKYGISKYNLVMVSPAMGKSKKDRGGNGIVRLSEDNARQRYLNPDEIRMLYKAVEAREGKDVLTDDLKLLVRLGLSTGARLTSLLNIRKSDINIVDATVIIKDFKNDSTYTGFINDGVINILESMWKDLKPTDCLIGRGKEPKHRTNINKALQPVLDKLFNVGLDVDDAQNRVVIHTLRHTFGSLLAIAGTPIFTIQKLMNHKGIEMTMRYAKLAPDQGKDAVRGLDI
jgi:integrase